MAGIIDEISLVEQVNQLVGQQPGEIVSPGHVGDNSQRTGFRIGSSVFVFPIF